MRFIPDHDLHIHTHLSPCSGDPTQTKEKLLAYGKENGIKKICITDHFWDTDAYPLFHPDYKGLDYDLVKKVLPLPEDDEVEFYLGAEIEMDKDMVVGVSKEHMEMFDFMPVATTHMHHYGYAIYHEDRGTLLRSLRYIERLEKFLSGDFPFYKMGIAHIVCTGIGEGPYGHLDVLDRVSDAVFYDIFKKAKEVGVGVELNIPFKNADGTMYYNDAQLEKILRPHFIAKDCGCQFYFGSDAHTERSLKNAKEQFNWVIDLLDLKEEDKFKPLENKKSNYK